MLRASCPKGAPLAQVTVEGNRIIAFWDQQYVVHWDDPNPWLTGKVGFRHIEGCNAVEWDNVKITTGAPGKIVAYDDYDPWGMVLEGRSGNVGNADARFKFTGKERDTETGYDYFGARYYDARIGRWLSVDPLAENHSGWTPYKYGLNNPNMFVDPDGRTEKERNKALNVATTLIGTPYKSPGMTSEGMDCSGFVRYCMTQNDGIKDPMRLWKEGDNGVATIVKASQRIQPDEIQPGNLLVIASGGRELGHVAFVSEVQRDDEGSVVQYSIIHAEAPWTNQSTGQRGGGSVKEATIAVGSGRGYAKNKYNHKFYKWDSEEKMNTATSNSGSAGLTTNSNQQSKSWWRQLLGW